MAEQATKTSSGVQDLISRLRDEGVESGKSEAARIVAAARREAASILEKARAEATVLRETTRSDIEKDREAALQGLKLAARDAVLELRDGVTQHFHRHVRRLVSEETLDKALVRDMVLVLAGHAASDFVKNQDAEILIAEALLEPKTGDEGKASTEARSRQLVLGITGNMLREGVELLPAAGIAGGAKVRVKGVEAEVDLTDEAVTALLMRHLLPRFQAILEGSD